MTFSLACLLVAVGSIWFPFPFLVQEIWGKRYFRFSFVSEGLVLLVFRRCFALPVAPPFGPS